MGFDPALVTNKPEKLAGKPHEFKGNLVFVGFRTNSER